jgi:hypothetical protein
MGARVKNPVIYASDRRAGSDKKTAIAGRASTSISLVSLIAISV